MLLDSPPITAPPSPIPGGAIDPPAGREPSERVVRLRAMVAEIIAMGPDVSTVDQVDQIVEIERIHNASAGLRAEVSVAFAAATLAEQEAANVRTRDLGRGICDQLGLARGISPQLAAANMALANQLATRFPLLGAALRSGALSERTAQTVVRECQHLDDDLARRADRTLDGKLVGLGINTVETAARFLAIDLDEAGYLARHTKALEARNVTMRPVADGMVRISGLVAMSNGVKTYAMLDKAARHLRSDGDTRTLGQIRADLFIEHLTGQAAGVLPEIELQIVIGAEAFCDGDSTPGVISGYGPVPAPWVRSILDDLDIETDIEERAKVWLRRVFVDPADDTVLAVDTDRRYFHPVVARWLRIRDANQCRMLGCDHTGTHLQHDHVQSAHTGGPSTVDNGEMACDSYNLLKELPGWTVTKKRNPNNPQNPTYVITTPTGHTYTTPPRPVFGPATRRTPPW